MRATLVLVAGLAFGGCSFFIDGAPNNYRPARGSPPPTCSTSPAAPIIDGLVAAASIAAFISARRSACRDPEDVNGCKLGSGFATLFFMPPALVYGLSAAVGTAKVTHCRSVTRAHAALQR